MLRGGNFARVLLGDVAQGDDVGMTEERVVVERKFGIERQHLATFGQDERVDLDHRTIARHEAAVEGGEKFTGRAHLRRRESEFPGQFARLIRLQSEGRIDRFAQNLLRGLGRDLLDVHPAFAAGHDHGRAGGAIHQDGEIKFFLDLDRLGDEHLVDQAAFRSGLMRDQCLPDHLGRDAAGLAGRLAKMHAALEAVGETSLAASAGVDLRFDHDGIRAEFAGHFLRIGRRAGHGTARVVRTEFGEEFLGLVFVDIHAW